MSIEVYLSLWLGPEGERDHAAVIGAALRSVVALNAPGDDPLFHRVNVAGVDTSMVRVEEKLETSDPADVLALIGPHLDATARVQVEASYDVIETSGVVKRLLEIQHYGPEHGWKGHARKSFGNLRCSFFTTRSFEDRRNFQWPLELARMLIRELDPLHLMVYTDLEVNPLTAHALYHRDVLDFARDINELARLHDRGGAYLQETEPGHFSHRTPWESAGDYGIYRRDGEPELIAAFERRLRPLLDLGRTRALAAQLGAAEILEALSTLRETRVERIGPGLLLSAEDAPFQYLEEPFIRLQEAAAGAPQS